MSIPLDANFKSMSCQLGGLRLNGIYNGTAPNSGTAQSLSLITIDDTASLRPSSVVTGLGTLKGYLQVSIPGLATPTNPYYYIPLYQ